MSLAPLLAAAREVQELFNRSGDSFCFIGGVAIQRWGEPRLTQDVDLTLLCELGSEEAVVRRVLSAFRPRMASAEQFALRNRVVLAESSSGFPIDIALGALPFES